MLSEDTRGERKEETKLQLNFFSKMPERAGDRGTRKIITISTKERVFSVTESKFFPIRNEI